MPARRAAVVAAALVALATATACASPDDTPAPRLCQSGGTAALCLESGDGDVRVTGHGFQPGSDVHVDVADGGGQLIPVAADGTFPAPGRTLGFLPGATAEVHRLDGVDKDGRPVSYVVTCMVDSSKQPRCAF